MPSTSDNTGLSIIPVRGIPEISKGDDIGAIISRHCQLEEFDVVVVSQKIVSKAEGRVRTLDEDDDDGFLKLVESESKRVLRRRGRLTITETRHHGFICANAGIDRSNTAINTVVLLPVDPDKSARRIRSSILAYCGINVAVIVTDTFGRPWRVGATDVAIGVAGVASVVDLRGHQDANGRILRATEINVADEIASAADLVKPKDGHVPTVIVRGLRREFLREASVKKEAIRSPGNDMFR